jgi:hypothetical protein
LVRKTTHLLADIFLRAANVPMTRPVLHRPFVVT